jgi:hypothetical protein
MEVLLIRKIEPAAIRDQGHPGEVTDCKDLFNVRRSCIHGGAGVINVIL